MKLTLNAGALATALQSVAGVVSRKSDIPILANVHLETGEHAVTFTATNLDQQSQVRVETARVEMAGTITTDARALAAIAARLPTKADLQIELVGVVLVLTSGRTRIELRTLPADAWVMLAGDEDRKVEASARFVAAELADALSLIEHAISRDATRPYLEGVHFEFHAAVDDVAAHTHIVATDAHRMATLDLAAGADLRAVILPYVAVRDTIKLCSDAADGDVALRFWGQDNPTLIEISAGAATYTSKLVDGNFPDWRRVIPGVSLPDQGVLSTVFDPVALADAVALVTAQSQDKSPSVALRCYGDGIEVRLNELTVEARTEIGAECDLDGMSEITSCVNARYITDALKVVGKSLARIQLIDAMTPWLMTPEDGDFRQVLMPITSRLPRAEDAAAASETEAAA